MPRGMRIIDGTEAATMMMLIERYRHLALSAGFSEVIIPSVWEQKTFTDKAGKEILNQMYSFEDKGKRELCLIPEVTAVVQETYRNEWAKTEKPVKIFYVNRCYRYERPQAGRYREFTQFGVEFLGGEAPKDYGTVLELARSMVGLTCEASEALSVKRGLDYYTGPGFEFSVSELGAQKQVAGGGRYETGVGFALGVDRLVIAKLLQEEASSAKVGSD